MTLDTPRTFHSTASKEEWISRAGDIREQILVSCGLWPMPEKCPLDAKIFGKVERDGYSVEKVHFKAYPGFYIAGNLYRPLGEGDGPFPAVLNPHGHWNNGRMADGKDGSIAARCISFARQGMVAFSYDMVGYNDTRFADVPAGGNIHRKYGTSRSDELWSINAMGIQLWSGIRALDFLESLPDVDRGRLACTGESGGGTQTFILGAVEDRLAAQVPVVMVSHSMQGGCNCENSPGLRVKYSNMDISAAAAPRPQMLVGATGDWTKTTMEIEGPSIATIYRLLGAEDRFHFERFDFGHNYNQTSREAVYRWLGPKLLENPEPSLLKEKPYTKEEDADLLVFPGGKLPDDALTMDEFIRARKEEHLALWQRLVPKDKAGLEAFKKVFIPAWRKTLQTTWQPGQETSKDVKEVDIPDIPSRPTCIIEFTGSKNLEVRDSAVILGVNGSSESQEVDEFSKFYTTYNRTALQTKAGELIEMVSALRAKQRFPRVVLWGSGRNAMAALMSAPAADAVVIDCMNIDPREDDALLEPGNFAPGLRRIGTYEGAAMLAAPNPLLLYNTGGKFPTKDITAAYRAAGAEDKLLIVAGTMTREEILLWAEKP